MAGKKQQVGSDIQPAKSIGRNAVVPPNAGISGQREQMLVVPGVSWNDAIQCHAGRVGPNDVHRRSERSKVAEPMANDQKSRHVTFICAARAKMVQCHAMQDLDDGRGAR